MTFPVKGEDGKVGGLPGSVKRDVRGKVFFGGGDIGLAENRIAMGELSKQYDRSRIRGD